MGLEIKLKMLGKNGNIFFQTDGLNGDFPWYFGKKVTKKTHPREP